MRKVDQILTGWKTISLPLRERCLAQGLWPGKIVGFGQGVAVRRRFQPLGLRRRARQGLRPSKLLAGKPCSISSGEKSSATTRWALHRLSNSLRKTLFWSVANTFLYRLVANELSTWNWGSRFSPRALVLLCTVSAGGSAGTASDDSAFECNQPLRADSAGSSG